MNSIICFFFLRAFDKNEWDHMKYTKWIFLSVAVRTSAIGGLQEWVLVLTITNPLQSTQYKFASDPFNFNTLQNYIEANVKQRPINSSFFFFFDILAQHITTWLGPGVIGRWSRGNIKLFLHPQTEMSVKLVQGNVAIWLLKIGCPRLVSVKGHNIMFQTEIKLSGNIYLHTL